MRHYKIAKRKIFNINNNYLLSTENVEAYILPMDQCVIEKPILTGSLYPQANEYFSK